MTGQSHLTDTLPHGSVVTEQIGLGWRVDNNAYGLPLGALAGLALRDNPRRAHLVVSTVLGKHIPARPAAIRASGLLLAALAHNALHPEHPPLRAQAPSAELLLNPDNSVDVAVAADSAFCGAPIVLGYCETATALGHTVADAFSGSLYVHTTRRPDPARVTVAGFDEEHSHAVAHHLQSPDGALADDRPLILVDDELTTGTTALNTIETLHVRHPRQHYVIATLLDLRDSMAREAFTARATALGVDVAVVALLDGALVVPSDVLGRAALLRAQLEAQPPAPALMEPLANIEVTLCRWPSGVAYGGRHGFSAPERPAFDEAITAVGLGFLERHVGRLTHPSAGGRILVVGTEELMYAPVRLAHWLELALRAHGRPDAVTMQSTTRSPVLPLDHSGYAIRRKLTFASPDDHHRDSFLYNVAPLSWTPAEGAPYTDIVVVTEDSAQACWPLLRALQPWARHTVHLVALGTGRS